MLNSYRIPITVRSEYKAYNCLFFMGREKLLLVRLVFALLSAMIAMPLGGRGKGQWNGAALTYRDSLTGLPRCCGHPNV